MRWLFYWAARAAPRFPAMSGSIGSPALRQPLDMKQFLELRGRICSLVFFQKVEEKIKRRAQLLGRKLSEAKRDRITIQKLKILESIVSEARFEPFKIS
jgi:hypothetical protein